MFYLIRKRTVETLVISLVCSAPLIMLLKSGLLKSSLALLFAVLGGSFLLFAAANVFLLHEFYMGVREAKGYFAVNLTSYTIYAVISTVFCVLSTATDSIIVSNANLYSGIFMPTRVFQVMNYITGISASRVPYGYSTVSALVHGDPISTVYISIMFSVVAVHIFMYIIICAVYAIDTARRLPDQFANESFTDEQLMDLFGYKRTPEEQAEYDRMRKELEEKNKDNAPAEAFGNYVNINFSDDEE